jgi:hypothetical protein
MTKYGILAVVPALALATPAVAQMDPADASLPAVLPAPPIPVEGPLGPVHPVAIHMDAASGATMETVVYLPGAVPPPFARGEVVALVAPGAPNPGFVWVPSHYNWDPAGQRYVWLTGQYVQPPRIGAQWVNGNWQLAGSQIQPRWVWVDGRWD